MVPRRPLHQHATGFWHLSGADFGALARDLRGDFRRTTGLVMGEFQMSTRLIDHGRLVNKNKAVEFTFNDKNLRGFEGDTLASALLANDQMLVGRSFKYHRPRGVVAAGAEEPNGLVNLGKGATFEPNQRVTTTELFDGLTATSQNHWPSLEFDVGAINSRLSTHRVRAKNALEGHSGSENRSLLAASAPGRIPQSGRLPLLRKW